VMDTMWHKGKRRMFFCSQ